MIDHTSLGSFQKSIWDILCPLFDRLLFDCLSGESLIEESLGVDVFLRPKQSDFVLYISITDERLYINSKYFDIYIYPEVELNKIRLLLQEILMGRYWVVLGFGYNNKLIFQTLTFENIDLSNFNEKKDIGFLYKEARYEEKIKGIQLICE